MLKKLKALLVFVLILPLMFSITACKDKKKDSDKGSQNEQGGETPAPEEPLDPELPVYTVSFDYDLPERLEGLFENSTITTNVGSNTELLKINNQKAAQYFLGWYDSDDNLVDSSVSAEENENISLIAKWNSGLNKYYYSDGLSFDVDTSNNFATVSGYSGNDTTIYLPKRYTYGKLDYVVKYIGESAFENSSVKNVKFELESLIIDQKAFKNSKIENFNFDGVYELRDEAFYGTKLSSVVIGEYLQTLGVSVFNSCEDLVSVDFSKNVMSTISSIPSSSFYNCKKLENVKFSNYITKINGSAFAKCESLSDFTFVEESNVSEISSYAFDNCSSFKEITLPYRISKIGYEVFRGCQNIKKITLGRLYFSQTGDSLSAYFGDLTETLEEVILSGNMIQTIPSYYFNNYKALTSFSMANSVETIGDGAFNGCVKLENLILSNNINIETFNVSSIKDTLWYCNLDECLVINNVLIVAPANLYGEVTIPEGVTKISASVFKDNILITKINIPSSVESIGQKAFYNCSGLEIVNFEVNNKLEIIKENTFYNCSSISSINLTNCKVLKTLEKAAFRNALNVEKIILPATLEIFGEEVFRNSKIQEFEISSNEKFATELGVLYEKNEQGDLVTILAYPKSNTATTFVVKDTVSSIKKYAFNNARNLKAVYIKSPDAGVEQNAFSGAGIGGFLKIYTEDLSVANTSLITVYKLADDNEYFVVDGENYTLELAEENNLVAGLYYAKIIDGDDIVLVRFNTYVSGETLMIEQQTVVQEVFEF